MRLFTFLTMALVAMATSASAVTLNLDGSPTPGDPALAYWLKADSLALGDGSAVSTWGKSSTAGSDATQASAAAQPTFHLGVLNGNPVVRFDGADDVLNTTGVIPATGADPRTILAVVTNTTDAPAINYRHVVHYGSGATDQAYGLASKTLPAQTGGGTNWGNHYWANGFSSGLAASTDPTLATIIYDGTTDSFFGNGQALGSKTFALNTGSGDSLSIGSRRANGEHFQGDIAEIIIFNEALGSDDRAAVEQYLGDKYGIAVGGPDPIAADVCFEDFSDVSSWTFNGSASQNGNRLQLTPSAVNQAGSAMITDPLAMQSDYRFNSSFSFQISQSGGIADADGLGADGLTFVIHGAGPNALGGSGGALGLDGISPFVAVEFDTWPSGSFDIGGNSGNHIGIDTSSSALSIAQTGFIADRFNDGREYFVWVDYDGDTQLLSVFYSLANVKPGVAALSANVDLATLFAGETELYVGFTAGTGSAIGVHEITSFKLQSVPEPVTTALVLVGFTALGLRRRRQAA